jgi:DNA-binding GntR family transcriptional regulator
MISAMNPPLHERVYHGLKMDYLEGRFTPGQRIDLQELANRYRASKTPVREAAFILMGEGLLSHHVDGGFLVPIRDPIELADLLSWHMRIVLGAVSSTQEADLRQVLERYVAPRENLSAVSAALFASQIFTSLIGAHGNRQAQDYIRILNERLHYSRILDAEQSSIGQKALIRLADVGKLNVRNKLIRKIKSLHAGHLSRLHLP